MSFDLPADLMVSLSGVRGRVGEALTPDIIVRFAGAFGAWLRTTRGDRPRVIVARDSRTSGPMFERAVIAALQSTGCNVIQVGLATTPTALLAVRHHRADGAIVVTASHNPVEWNALKFASAAGMFLDAEEAPAMRAFLADGAIRRASWDRLGELEADAEAAHRHIAAVLAIPYLDVTGLRARRFRVALDCIRGAGSTLLPPVLEALGCEVIGINMEPDGRFPRPPEPVAANLGELEARVRQSGADLGMATDPDGDRLSLVSNTGHAIGEDHTLAIATWLVLRHRAGPVVTNLSTSRVVEDVALAANAPFERAPVGEINVARAMERAGAVVGGEGNGGVILPDLQMTRDAGAAAALALQALLEADRPMDRFMDSFASYHIVKDTLPHVGGPIEEAYALLEERLDAPVADRRDGLRLEWPDLRQWLHLRASGTEPILRIIAEAPSRNSARSMVESARQTLARIHS
ncbi:MAG: phosphoglucosamine mutase [Longimicrobiales bacterium]